MVWLLLWERPVLILGAKGSTGLTVDLFGPVNIGAKVRGLWRY